MTDKEIIIDGVDVSGCDELWLNSEKNYDSKCIRFKDVYSQCSYCKDNPNCEYKQLQKEKFENLNNRQMVESAENLIYENSELIKNLKEKEQECEELKAQLNDMACMDDNNVLCYPRQELKKECERYKQALDKIENYFSSQDTTRTSLFNIHCIEQEIKNIINKAKENN